jgi:hypothetical protein
MRPAVEHDMLPDLVGQCDRPVPDAGLGKQPELVRPEHPGGGIVRVVEDGELRPGREGGVQRLARDPPVRRRQPDEARHSAGPKNHRKVEVVERLEEQDLVARLDQCDQRGRQRLGRAGGDDDRGRSVSSPWCAP